MVSSKLRLTRIIHQNQKLQVVMRFLHLITNNTGWRDLGVTVLGNLTLASFCLLLVSLTLGSFGQICLKLGLREAPIKAAGSIPATFLNIIHSMMQPYVMLGLALYVISTFTWLLLISRVRLSVAYPMISISYVMVMLLSFLILHETIHWGYALGGLFCIGVGVSFVGLGMGQAKGNG